MKKPANEFVGHMKEKDIRKALLKHGIDGMKKRAGYIPEKTTDKPPKKKKPAIDYYFMKYMDIGQKRLLVIGKDEHTVLRKNSENSYSVVKIHHDDIPF